MTMNGMSLEELKARELELTNQLNGLRNQLDLVTFNKGDRVFLLTEGFGVINGSIPGSLAITLKKEPSMSYYHTINNAGIPTIYKVGYKDTLESLDFNELLRRKSYEEVLEESVDVTDKIDQVRERIEDSEFKAGDTVFGLRHGLGKVNTVKGTCLEVFSGDTVYYYGLDGRVKPSDKYPSLLKVKEESSHFELKIELEVR